MSCNKKCYCGHARKNHHSWFYGQRNYTKCKHCDCKQYSGNSYGKEEWERMQKVREDADAYRSSVQEARLKKEAEG